jgi:hypothetical protein
MSREGTTKTHPPPKLEILPAEKMLPAEKVLPRVEMLPNMKILPNGTMTTPPRHSTKGAKCPLGELELGVNFGAMRHRKASIGV